MEQAAAQARYDDAHSEDARFHNGDFTKWSGERSSATPYHYMDGVTVIVAEANLFPDDDFLAPVKGSRSDSPL